MLVEGVFNNTETNGWIVKVSGISITRLITPRSRTSGRDDC